MKRTLVISMLCAAIAVLAVGCNFGNSSANMKQAHRSAVKKDWATVREITEKQLHAVPTDNDAAVLLALALFHTESTNPDAMQRAINYMRQALTTEKERYDLHLIYGWILLNTGRYQEARTPLQTAYDLHLKESRSIGQDVQGMIKYALGRCCMMNGMYSDAMKYYEQASKSSDFHDWPTLYNDLACCAVYSSDFASAMKWLNQAIEAEKQAKNKAEKEIMSNPNAPMYRNPYEYTLHTNTAVVCDYLSFPQYNSTNASAYVAARKAWYASAYSMLASAAQSSTNASEQKLIKELQNKVALRYSAISAAK